MPARIQLSRARGFRLPDSAVRVARPSVWGNPYPVGVWGRELALTLFAETARGCWSPRHVEHLCDANAGIIYRAHCDWNARVRRRFGCSAVEAARGFLRGMDLACWCKPGEACHADILLEIANEGGGPPLQRGDF